MASGMANPFSNEPVRRPPPPNLGQREWVRLWLMGGAFVFIIVAMTALYFLAVKPRPEKKPGKDEVKYDIRDPRKEKPRPPVRADQEQPKDEPGETPPKQDPPKEQPQQDPPKEEPKEPTPAPPAQEGDEFRNALEEFRVEDIGIKIEYESPGFIFLLGHFLKKATPEEVTASVNAAIRTKDLFDAPDRHRGQFVRFYGRLIKIYTETIHATTPTGGVVYLGIMSEYGADQQQRTAWFFLPERPAAEFHTRKHQGEELYNEFVEVEGVFLRLYEYEGNAPEPGGPSPRVRAAVVFAKNLRLAPPPPGAPDHKMEFILWIGGGAAILIAIVLFGGYMSRRYGGGSIHMRLYEVKRKKAVERGEKVLPEPSPGKQVLGAEVPKPDPGPGAPAP